MSDFLGELRGELLDAHADRRRRRAPRRLVRAVVADGPRALAVATAMAVLVAAVIAVRPHLAPDAGGLRVLDVVRVGGNLTGMATVDGTVVVGDFAGERVVRLSSGGRTLQRIPVRGQPVAITAGAGGAWVRTAIGDGGVVARVGGRASAQVGYGGTLAATADAAWASDVETGPEGLHRVDARTGRSGLLIALPGVYALAATPGSLWAVTGNGTVLRLDTRTGAVRKRWPAVALSSGTAAPAIAADARGVWVLRVGQGGDSRAIRIEGDRVTRRLPIGGNVRPLLAVTPEGLWTVTEDPLRHRYAAVRLDPRRGGVTARVDLGERYPTALARVGDELWVSSSDGTISVLGEP